MRVHEDVGADLQLVIDAARPLERIGPGARSLDIGAVKAMPGEQVARLARLGDGAGGGVAALGIVGDVLGAAVIGLQAAKAQPRRLGDAFGQGEGRRARLDAAAIAADIDLDKHVDCDAVGDRRLAQRFDMRDIVDADGDARLAREGREPGAFARPGDLVADQHVGDAALHHRLGLADLLAAHADRTERHLAARDDRRFMRLGMRPQADAHLLRAVGQPRQIALEGIEIEQQSRGLDLGEAHADFGGGRNDHMGAPTRRADNPAAAITYCRRGPAEMSRCRERRKA